MDIKAFTKEHTGNLLHITEPQEDWAFVPNLMPPAWEFPARLGELLGDARESLGRLDGLGQGLEDPDLLVIPLQNREAISSSSLEGTYVTPEQLLLYRTERREPLSRDDRASDWQEVLNYCRAMKRGCEMLDVENLPLLLRVIKEMHRILLLGVHGRGSRPGEFRKWQVQIGSSGRFLPPPHGAVDKLMNDLEKYMNARDERFNPLIQCFVIHYQFEAIHPFVDGNGRVGRSLLALMIYKLLGHKNPWLYLSAFFEKFKDEYISNLFRISTHGDWDSWIEFCLRGTIWQAKDAIRRCKRFKEVRAEYLEDACASPRSYPIIEGLFNDPIVTAPSLAKKHNVTYPTARADIDRLVEVNILKEIPDTRPKAFFASKIMAAAYSEPEEV